jgi:hypothetical protein
MILTSDYEELLKFVVSCHLSNRPIRNIRTDFEMSEVRAHVPRRDNV